MGWGLPEDIWFMFRTRRLQSRGHGLQCIFFDDGFCNVETIHQCHVTDCHRAIAHTALYIALALRVRRAIKTSEQISGIKVKLCSI